MPERAQGVERTAEREPGQGISPSKAAELRGRLKQIMDELNDEQTENPDGVPVNLLIGCYVPAEGDAGRR